MIEQSKSYVNYGEQFWYLPSEGRGYWHRLDGPAIIMGNGTKEWFVHNLRHRIDGPAYECPTGRNHWFVNGKDVTKEVEEWIEQFDIDMNTDEGKMRFKLVWV